MMQIKNKSREWVMEVEGAEIEEAILTRSPSGELHPLLPVQFKVTEADGEVRVEVKGRRVKPDHTTSGMYFMAEAAIGPGHGSKPNVPVLPSEVRLTLLALIG